MTATTEKMKNLQGINYSFCFVYFLVSIVFSNDVKHEKDIFLRLHEKGKTSQINSLSNRVPL